MSVAQNDPDEGWQKRVEMVCRRSFLKLQAFFRKVLVHRKTLMIFIKVGVLIYKLVKIILSFF